MINGIQSLANMEYQLYGNMAGGYGAYNAPSIVNGYCAVNPNTYSYGYPNFNGYTQDIFTQAAQPTAADQWGGTFTRATANDMVPVQSNISRDAQVLADYYANNNVLDEGLKGAATGGLTWMAFEHAQSLFHPLNARKGVLEAEKIFKNIAKDAEFMKGNSILIQDAYTAAQQAIRDTESKWFYSGWLRKPIDRKDIEPLLEELKSALASKDPNKIALATERLQAARGFDGRLIPGKKLSVAERLANKSKVNESFMSKFGIKSKNPQPEITKNVENLLGRNSGKFSQVAKSFFKKDFRGFMIFETVFGLGKIFTAFQKDTKTGVAQTGQTLGKAALGTAGWCVGRAGGALLGAKLGAAIGSAVPGLGTLVGGLVGFTVGSIGMWLGHKLGNKIFGKDVADKAEADQLAKSPEGHVQLLQFTAQKAQENQNIPPEVIKAYENLMNQYSSAA